MNRKNYLSIKEQKDGTEALVRFRPRKENKHTEVDDKTEYRQISSIFLYMELYQWMFMELALLIILHQILE